jgi:hypothetical protein
MMPSGEKGRRRLFVGSVWGSRDLNLSPNLRDLNEEGAVLLSQKMSDEGFLALSLDNCSIVCA